MHMRRLELRTGMPRDLVGVAQVGHAVHGEGQSFAGLETFALEDARDLLIGKLRAELTNQIEDVGIGRIAVDAHAAL